MRFLATACFAAVLTGCGLDKSADLGSCKLEAEKWYSSTEIAQRALQSTNGPSVGQSPSAPASKSQKPSGDGFEAIIDAPPSVLEMLGGWKSGYMDLCMQSKGWSRRLVLECSLSDFETDTPACFEPSIWHDLWVPDKPTLSEGEADWGRSKGILVPIN